MTETTRPREQASPDMNNPDTLAALLCCLYEGPEIELAATMLIEQAMELEELRAAPVDAPEAPTLPTNDEVYAEVRRLRQGAHHYVSTNAVNDTMQAVRSLLASTGAAPLVPEVAASEQQTAAWRFRMKGAQFWQVTANSEVADTMRGHANIEVRALVDATPAATTASDPAMYAGIEVATAPCDGRFAAAATTASASGQTLYEAWVEHGKHLRAPKWDELPTSTQIHWNKEAIHGRATAPSRNAAPLNERALFEAEWRLMTAPALQNYSVDAHGDYSNRELFFAWRMWQFRAALTQQSAAQAPISIEGSAWDELVRDLYNSEKGRSFGIRLEGLIGAAQASHAGADTERDADRFRSAIALEDNAETLYAAVLNHAPDAAEIRREFDAAMSAATPGPA